eukprot:767696-Hanusia_phi.AAC.7
MRGGYFSHLITPYHPSMPSALLILSTRKRSDLWSEASSSTSERCELANGRTYGIKICQGTTLLCKTMSFFDFRNLSAIIWPTSVTRRRKETYEMNPPISHAGRFLANLFSFSARHALASIRNTSGEKIYGGLMAITNTMSQKANQNCEVDKVERSIASSPSFPSSSSLSSSPPLLSPRTSHSLQALFAFSGVVVITLPHDKRFLIVRNTGIKSFYPTPPGMSQVAPVDDKKSESEAREERKRKRKRRGRTRTKRRQRGERRSGETGTGHGNSHAGSTLRRFTAGNLRRYQHVCEVLPSNSRHRRYPRSLSTLPPCTCR